MQLPYLLPLLDTLTATLLLLQIFLLFCQMSQFSIDTAD